MSRDYGGPAFPREDYLADDSPGQRGMDLRDFFAAKAMQSLLRDMNRHDGLDQIAFCAYAAADAMIAERAK